MGTAGTVHITWLLYITFFGIIAAQQGGRDTDANYKVARNYLEIPFKDSQDLISQIASGNLSGLLPWVASTVQGKVAPLGTFSDLLGFAEYVYGIPLSFDWRTYTVYYIYAVENMVFFRYDANGSIPATNTLKPQAYHTTFPVTGSFTFDDQGKVCAVDLSFSRYGLLLEDSWMKALYYPIVFPEMFCDGLMARCIGKNQQFDSLAQCNTFMKTISFGLTDRIDQNTVLCRQFHWMLSEYAPEVHCSHSGPQSKKCVDKKPQDYVPIYTCASNSITSFSVNARGKFN